MQVGGFIDLAAGGLGFVDWAGIGLVVIWVCGLWSTFSGHILSMIRLWVWRYSRAFRRGRVMVGIFWVLRLKV